ncbi:MAG: aspartate aminotransferase family protein [Chlorobi bacterium]|nr:aspartate aminotransferase family protein [Chlorobiota bacterium]
MTNREIFYRNMGLPSTSPMGIEMEKADGIYIYDSEGKEFIDLVSGVSVSNIGHRHPKVIEAIHKQLEKYMHLMVYGEFIQSPQVQLAKNLTDHLPENLDAVYFVNSGSEAIEGALKLAKRFTNRSEIIAFKNAYHGGTHGALSILGNESLKFAFRPLLPDIRFLGFNNEEDLEQITEKTACVVAEAVQAEAGILLPQNDFLKKLRKKCDETGTLLIVDDIQMGFGRTGKLFSFQNFGIVPDILALAKGMGGGMPIGAFVATKKLMDSLTFQPELGHVTTFGGHPVSCAAANANLNVILENELSEKANDKGNIFKEEMENQKGVTEVRQIGLMLGIDLESEKMMDKLLNLFTRNGLIADRFLFRSQAFRIAPPLTITNEEIEKTIGILEKCFGEL